MIGGGVLLVIGLAIIFSSISSLINVADSLPQISAKDLIKSSLGTIVKGNQSTIRVNLEKVGFEIALNSFGIIVSIILLVNSVIAFVAGIIVLLYDRRSKHLVPAK
ncbi:MAG TPA: hypothetical protein VH796_01180 [Nitrososphaeraceae archaeon]